MARVSRPKINTSGLYALLVDSEEQRYEVWDASVARSHAEGAPYPRQRILDALRNHEPVNVPTWSLPAWAQAGAPTRRGRFGLATIRPSRAIVRPDDTVIFNDHDWDRLWLQENDV